MLVRRIVAIVTAGALLVVFLVPAAAARHDYRIVTIVCAIFIAYVAVNAWIFVRMHRRS